MIQKEYLGVDVGASGIKGAIVDIKKGTLVSERIRIPTPNPSTPKAVAKAFAELLKEFDWKNKYVGCGFPAIIKNGVAHTASNIHKSWIGTDASKLFSDASSCEVFIKNDADVAGIGEMKFGAGKGHKGTVLIVTVGSGLGSALFVENVLVPNTEFGHFYLKGHNNVVEKYAADSIRKQQDLSWKAWGERFDHYLQHMNFLLSPDMIILGGGASKKFEKFEKCITVDTLVRPAQLLNNAGIIGAAIHAYEVEKSTRKKSTV